MPFRTELELSRRALEGSLLQSSLGFDGWDHCTLSEVSGFFGIPDTIFGFAKHDGKGRPIVRSVAIEFKLTHWQRALVQAYRYRAFSDYSVVVLDAASVAPAVGHCEQFRKSHVGLASLSVEGGLEWHVRPKYATPYAPSLRTRMRRLITTACVNRESVRSDPTRTDPTSPFEAYT